MNGHDAYRIFLEHGYDARTLNAGSLRAARRELAKMYHIDKGGDPAVLGEINAAYDLIADWKKRGIEPRSPRPQPAPEPEPVHEQPPAPVYREEVVTEPTAYNQPAIQDGEQFGEALAGFIRRTFWLSMFLCFLVLFFCVSKIGAILFAIPVVIVLKLVGLFGREVFLFFVAMNSLDPRAGGFRNARWRI